MDTQNPNLAPVQDKSNNTPPQQTNTGMAILAYLGILIIIPFLTEAKNDPFVKFHLKQGLALIISEIVVSLIYAIPFGGIIASLLWIFNIVMVVIGITNAAAGKEKELPILGQIAKNFNF